MNTVPVLLLFFLSVGAYNIEEVERDDFRRREIDERGIIEGRGIEIREDRRLEDLNRNRHQEEYKESNRHMNHRKSSLFASGAILGIDSLITPVLNALPQLSRAILDAVERGEVEKARMLQKKMSSAADAVQAEGGINAWKAAMEIITGLKMGPPHLPLRPISHAARVRIASALKACGVI